MCMAGADLSLWQLPVLSVVLLSRLEALLLRAERLASNLRIRGVLVAVCKISLGKGRRTLSRGRTSKENVRLGL